MKLLGDNHLLNECNQTSFFKPKNRPLKYLLNKLNMINCGSLNLDCALAIKNSDSVVLDSKTYKRIVVKVATCR